jgi:hypothetical protein
MIFRVLQIRKMVDEATDNPGKFTGGQIRELFVNMLIAPLLFVLFFLGIFFVFGFTALLGGPFLFFKFLFWISLIIILSVLYFLIKIYRIIKSLTEEVVESTLKVESKIIE